MFELARVRVIGSQLYSAFRALITQSTNLKKFVSCKLEKFIFFTHCSSLKLGKSLQKCCDFFSPLK